MKKDRDKTQKLDSSIKQRLQELEDGWKRTQADFENYRKRTESERGEVLEMMKADFLTKITPVLDNFRRAFEHAPVSPGLSRRAMADASRGGPDDEFARGIKHIEKQLSELLASEGLQRINANAGTKFDPNIHEAVTHEPNKKIPLDHIIAELESGWMFSDRVIKPAKVRVSKGKE